MVGGCGGGAVWDSLTTDKQTLLYIIWNNVRSVVRSADLKFPLTRGGGATDGNHSLVGHAPYYIIPSRDVRR